MHLVSENHRNTRIPQFRNGGWGHQYCRKKGTGFPKCGYWPLWSIP